MGDLAVLLIEEYQDAASKLKALNGRREIATFEIEEVVPGLLGWPP